MNIQVAKHAGFCFGVRRATKAAEDALEQGAGAIYTLGRLIHNDGYVAGLRRRGMGEISPGDLDDICRRAESGERITVIIRAHGEVRENLSRLLACAKEHENLTVLDCTCPYVTKVREIAAAHSGEKQLFILIGAADHPEVQGIMSCCRGEGRVFDSAAALERWIGSDEGAKYADFLVSIAAQTTQNLSEWKKCLKIIKKVYTNALIFDTICNVTEERQPKHTF